MLLASTQLWRDSQILLQDAQSVYEGGHGWLIFGIFPGLEFSVSR